MRAVLTLSSPTGRKLGLGGLKLLVGLVWSLLVLYVAAGIIKESPVKLPFRQSMGVVTVAPEGWGFFTRDPRLANPHLYRRVGERWVAVGEIGSRFEDGLGLDRASRAQGIEISKLLAPVPPKAFKNCEGGLEHCLASDPPLVIPVANSMHVRSLCGDLAVEVKPPVPWAWSRSKKTPVMPSKIALLEVTC